MREGYQLKKSYEAAPFRLLSFIIAKVNSNPDKSFPTMKEFWPLPLIDNKDSGEVDEDHIKKILRKYKEGKLYKK